MAIYGQGIYGQAVYGSTAALTLTVQGTYPERVLVTATGLIPGITATVTRTLAGETTRTAIRSADSVAITDTVLVAVDAEAPAGTLLTYRLTTDSVDADAETATLALVGAALSDAITGDAAQVVILSWPSKKRTRNSAVFEVGGRNIVVAGARGGFSGTIEIFTETDDQKTNLLNLLANATSGILQLRSDRSVTSEGVDCYISVLSDDEMRYSQDGSDERRIISLDVVETGPWGPTLESPSFTLNDINLAYPSPDDLADLNAAYPGTLLDIAVGDFS